MDNFYQINLPSRVTPNHADLNPSVIHLMAAPYADEVFISGTFPNTISEYRMIVSTAGNHPKDIYLLNPITNQKKEVDDEEMNELQHCKSIQYNMKLSSLAKFFNN